LVVARGPSKPTLTNATLPASAAACRSPRVAFVGIPRMNSAVYMSTMSPKSRRNSGSPPDKNTRATPARLPRIVSSSAKVGSGSCNVSEQNEQSKLHRFVT
jgi:hypothetical protein